MRAKVLLLTLFLIFGVMLAIPAVFAPTSGTGSVSVTAGGVSGAIANAENVSALGVSSPFLKYGDYAQSSVTKFTDPSWSPVVDASGSVTAGDVYYVDAGDFSGDILVRVFVTNPEELVKAYSSLQLKFNVWKKGATYAAPTGVSSGTNGWQQATYASGSAIGSVYWVLSEGEISFILSGGQEYALTIDGGSWHCISATAGDLSPDFNLIVEQA